MKNNFVVAIFQFLTIYIIVHGCDRDPCRGVLIMPAMEEIESIRFNLIDYQLNNNGTELDMKLYFDSDFADNACLALFVYKRFNSSPSYLPFNAEGFKDSLKIDGFHIRSYTTSFYDDWGIGTLFDFPVYAKYAFIEKGKNQESFKIVFPNDIAINEGKVFVDFIVFKFNELPVK